MAKRKTATATAAKKLKRDIRKAVKSIPELIMGNMTASGVSTPPIDPPTPPFKAPEAPKIVIPPPHPNRHIVWIGAIGMGILVFVMWFLNAKTMLSKIRLSDSTEATIATTAITDFENAINNVKTKESPEIEKEKNGITKQIQTILQTQFAFASTTATTSSSIETVSSTLTTSTLPRFDSTSTTVTD